MQSQPQAPIAANQGSDRGEIEMERKFKVAKQITQLFNLERYVYVACCGIAVVLLLVNAGLMISKGGVDRVGLGLLFGASGFITYSIGRLIYMWNRVVDLILSEAGAQGGRSNGN